MEDKKFDPYQFIGFVLIALIMTWMLMNQQPVEEGTDAVTMTGTQAETVKEVGGREKRLYPACSTPK
jgi:hypothetical protein